MKPTKAQREWVERQVKKWLPRLNLKEWSVDIYHEEGEERVAASCNPDPVYLHAKVFIHPCFWNNRPKVREMMIVHELCHLITEESYLAHIDSLNFKVVTADHINEIRERLTQRITNIAFRDEWK